MTRVRPYYAENSLSAAFYEVVAATDVDLPGDIDLYAGLASPGEDVLELGAGSGRIAFALAERGFAVTGVDLSPAMLAKAQARLSQLPPEQAARLEFRRGDMTALDLKRSFDLVLCPFFTLAHVPAGAAWRNTFATMARHLKPGGLAAVHLPIVETMRRLPPVPRDALVLDQPLTSGGRLQMHVLERRFREDISRLDQVLEYVERDASGRVLRRSPERLTYYVAAPQPFAEAAGLAAEEPPRALGTAGEVWIFRKS